MYLSMYICMFYCTVVGQWGKNTVYFMVVLISILIEVKKSRVDFDFRTTFS